MNKRLFTVTFTAVVTLLCVPYREMRAGVSQSRVEHVSVCVCGVCMESVHYIVTFIIILTTIFLS